MNTNDLLEELNGIFRDVFELPHLQINAQTSARDISAWDSMHHVLLIDQIEKHFQVEFDLNELVEFHCVGDIVASLSSKKNMNQ